MDALQEAMYVATKHIIENTSEGTAVYNGRIGFEKFIEKVNMRHVPRQEEQSNQHLFTLEFLASMSKAIAIYKTEESKNAANQESN